MGELECCSFAALVAFWARESFDVVPAVLGV